MLSQLKRIVTKLPKYSFSIIKKAKFSTYNLVFPPHNKIIHNDGENFVLESHEKEYIKNLTYASIYCYKRSKKLMTINMKTSASHKKHFVCADGDGIVYSIDLNNPEKYMTYRYFAGEDVSNLCVHNESIYATVKRKNYPKSIYSTYSTYNITDTKYGLFPRFVTGANVNATHVNSNDKLFIVTRDGIINVGNGSGICDSTIRDDRWLNYIASSMADKYILNWHGADIIDMIIPKIINIETGGSLELPCTAHISRIYNSVFHNDIIYYGFNNKIYSYNTKTEKSKSFYEPYKDKDILSPLCITDNYLSNCLTFVSGYKNKDYRYTEVNYERISL